MDAVIGTGLAVTNFLALSSWHVQWKPLIGDEGITPAKDYVKRARELVFPEPEDEEEEKTKAEGKGLSGRLKGQLARWKRNWQRNWKALKRCPSLFLLTGADDRILKASLAFGYFCVLLMAMGWLPSLSSFCFALLWASIANVSSPWMGLQFESLLCEANLIFSVGFLFSAFAPSALIVAARFLTFRLLLGAGIGKLGAGDRNWRNGLAMTFHYESQPLPNGLSRFFHNLPEWYHKLETRLTFLFEGPLTFLFWLPDWRLRAVAFIGTAAFNFAIGSSGNYGFLHSLTIVAALSVVTEMGSTGVAPFCSFGGSLSPSEPDVSAFMPWLLRALHSASSSAAAFYGQSGSAAAAAASSSHLPWFLYQSCPASGGLVSPLFASIPWPWKTTDGLLSFAFSVAGNLLFCCGWLLGWSAALCYLLVSLVPFSMTFQGLVTFSESIPFVWDWANDAFELLQRWRMVGLYMLFNSMTKGRWEFEIQGTADGKNWYFYRFRNKPSGPAEVALNERPKTLIVGHFQRFDWRCWFLPLQAERIFKMGVDVSTAPSLRASWYDKFCEQLLEGSHDPDCSVVRGLLEVPAELKGKKLLAVRTLMMDYKFTLRGTPPYQPTTAAEPQAMGEAPPSSSSSSAGPAIMTLQAARSATSLPSKSDWQVGSFWKRRFVGLYNVKVAPADAQRQILGLEHARGLGQQQPGVVGSASSASGSAASSASALPSRTGAAANLPSSSAASTATKTTTATAPSSATSASRASDAYRAYHGHYSDEDDDEDEDDGEEGEEDDVDEEDEEDEEEEEEEEEEVEEEEEEEEEEEAEEEADGTSALRRRKRDPLDLADD